MPVSSADLRRQDQDEAMDAKSDSSEAAAGFARAAMTPEDIWSRVETRTDEMKGRVLHTKRALSAGHVVFAELCLFCSTPDLEPELWAEMSAACESLKLALPCMWHFAGLLALIKLDAEKLKIFNSKWVPEEYENETQDSAKLLAAIKSPLVKGVTAQALHRATLIYRYNSFGHKEDPNGLAVYDIISYMSHSCDPNVIWHYGDGLTSVLIAKRALRVGEELSISYIADEEMYKSTDVRREKLQGWLFTCQCERCVLGEDRAAGFACPTCFQGTIYWNHAEHRFRACAVCNHAPTQAYADHLVGMETHYKALVEADLDKSDAAQCEEMLREASQGFSKHWIQHELNTALYTKYKGQQQWREAVECQKQRVDFFTTALVSPTYTSAWAFEELGDALQNLYNDMEPKSARVKHEMLLAFRRSYHLLIVLCGRTHQYTCNAYGKFLDAGGKP